MSDLVERLNDLAGQRHRDRGLDAVDDALREAASRISQQDAELERWKARAEYAEASLAETRRVAFIEAAEIAGQDRTPGYGPHRDDMEYLADAQRRNIAERIRAKAEETGR